MTARIHLRAAFWAGVCLLAVGSALQLSARPDEAEDAIKAVAVLNFIRYSTWTPPIVDPLVVGVNGRPGFLDTLRATLQSRPINGRTVRVVEVRNVAEAQSCQLLYLATSRVAQIQPFLSSPVLTHTLTIGESDRFLDLGGAVNFYLADGHIAFEASLDALDKAGILVSSNLLRLGQVRARGRTRGQP